MKDARQRAWETRREKYGPKGHAGGYGLAHTYSRRRWAQMVLEEVELARRQCQILLPEKAAHRAIDRIDNAIRWLELI